METTQPTPAQPEGRVFTRELRGNTLLVNSLIQLGSLNEGEIVHETDELIQLINTSQSTNLIIDLSRGDYLGTVMLAAIVKLWKRISQCGGRLALCNVSENVAQVLQLTKLDTIWTIYDTRDQALGAITG
jgi:anti-sigma B factor antagonist